MKQILQNSIWKYKPVCKYNIQHNTKYYHGEDCSTIGSFSRESLLLLSATWRGNSFICWVFYSVEEENSKLFKQTWLKLILNVLLSSLSSSDSRKLLSNLFCRPIQFKRSRTSFINGKLKYFNWCFLFRIFTCTFVYELRNSLLTVILKFYWLLFPPSIIFPGYSRMCV